VGISPASLQNRCVYSVYSNRSDGSCARFTWPRRTHIPPGPLASALAGKMPIRRRSFPRAARALRGFSLLQALAATWRAAAFPERAFGPLQGQSLGRDSAPLLRRSLFGQGSQNNGKQLPLKPLVLPRHRQPGVTAKSTQGSATLRLGLRRIAACAVRGTMR
jgi:hypothetical protein